MATTLDETITRESADAGERPTIRPLALSDDELSAIMRACDPLPPDRRDAFVQEVASALASCGEIGPGSVFRVIRDVQKRLLDPVDMAYGRGVGRWR